MPRLLVIEPFCMRSTPSMKGFMNALPAIRSAGFEVEMWCWRKDEDAAVDRHVAIPVWPHIHTISIYIFIAMVSLRAFWVFTVLRRPKPDLSYAIAWTFPVPDICHVHFSQWDWGEKMRILGIKTFKDAFHACTNFIGLSLGRLYIHCWPARRYLAVSSAVAADLLNEQSGLNVGVLPNAFDPGRFNLECRSKYREQKRKELGYDESHSVFLFASIGHYRRKGFDLAIDAIALLQQQHPGTRLLVVGGSPDAIATLHQRVASKHPDCDTWLKFTGTISDMERYYAAADGLLFPSYSEAFALVEIEAAACGLPLFLTKHHGSEMVMEDGKNGLWIDFEPEKIATTLADYISGRWKPIPTPLKSALDSEAYAKRLIAEFNALL
ncbi:MAG: glycosyltransferase family 4 protein [Verrucomicrobiaceae bacterium]|nr:glycosyltransferase family 4 protein [Verrucomicrobiaceae bacterium]